MCRIPDYFKSSLALRNLRGVVIILILAFHSFSAYIVSQPASPGRFDEPPYTWRAFPIIDSERWIGFDLLCAFMFLYLMQLMFFLSGLFVWPSLSSRCAIRGWYVCADANHLLSGVLRHRRRSDVACLLGTLDGSPNLADWTNVVLV